MQDESGQDSHVARLLKIFALDSEKILKCFEEIFRTDFGSRDIDPCFQWIFVDNLLQMFWVISIEVQIPGDYLYVENPLERNGSAKTCRVLGVTRNSLAPH